MLVVVEERTKPSNYTIYNLIICGYGIFLNDDTYQECNDSKKCCYVTKNLTYLSNSQQTKVMKAKV